LSYKKINNFHIIIYLFCKTKLRNH